MLCSLDHIKGFVVDRGSSARIKEDNCGVSADHVVWADRQTFVAVAKDGCIPSNDFLL